MGCISCKLLPAGDPHIFSGDKYSITIAKNAGDLPNHCVSLTSSTYGVLNLDPFENQTRFQSPKSSIPNTIPKLKKPQSFSDSSPEIINWILADDQEDAGIHKRSKSPPFFHTPSPEKHKKFSGKENKTPRLRTDPSRVLKPLNLSEKKKSGSKRSLSPLFDPDLVASFERELNSEVEQIKRMVAGGRRKEEDETAGLLLSLEEKCPPGGEKAVVLYTTSLRGIRKTYEDCNLVRSLIASYNVCVIERDVSMDLGFREELRSLMGGSRELKMPVLFVKGRMVGGAEEVLRLEEDGKMEFLMEGMPKGEMRCGECGGMRFVMCKECNGSCRVLDEGKKKKVRCGLCNENGLVYCPSCNNKIVV
ncbi:uncharacterized protein At3g28850 [Phalaenopsis equestris]|uniref:uncharacterized protein At3g28850 n=1 Tax=Phalaenopsis equestris TaxID=78828 RepID=UPI0009E475FF|nr:uncharacterized protein At3g28850 [Phalaenopsis equestris]